ncbi:MULTISPECIES: MbcA/ParS/Xre antitoxin family protein [Ramlibacter]|uniref:DUF2384 domain-containing protein n=1 Tax=Ramlibacter aquaticus TaxID=2780094 RepID=A0ABR9SCZ7_9BURK|nr:MULTISPECIES: MbcA/ParS/Xre antitoxin family protein [Ramlibacter]MBE7940094.1 DUF2384 domain-containing protein [Ramlibacter aquaticus]
MALAITQDGAAAQVLSKATVRSADLLGLSRAALARIIGLSEATIGRLAAGTYTLELGSKPAELATLVVRLYRSLDALVGNDDESRRAWMRSHNTALGAQPRAFIETVDGLTYTVRYLDGARAQS